MNFDLKTLSPAQAAEFPADALLVLVPDTLPKGSSPLHTLVAQALKSEDLFNGADFFTLWDKEKQVLGGDLLTRREYEVQPGGTVSKVDSINKDAAYIGVVAAFRQINSSTWRAIVKANKGGTNRIQIVVGQNTISVKRVSNNWLLRQFSEIPLSDMRRGGIAPR